MGTKRCIEALLMKSRPVLPIASSMSDRTTLQFSKLSSRARENDPMPSHAWLHVRPKSLLYPSPMDMRASLVSHKPFSCTLTSALKPLGKASTMRA
jgi:hypothetical protein